MSEFETFFWLVTAGFAIGLGFDIYRSVRRWMKWGPILTFGGDILFSFGALVIFLFFLEKANSLAFRFYIFWVSLLGLLLYLRLFSRLVTHFLLSTFDLVKKTLLGLISLFRYPLRALVLLMRPLYAFLRWLSLLFYRAGEALLMPRAVQIKREAGEWWDQHFPPRTNG
ncbi:spore cortex biosynthesis protein YabQ [Paradesulfitobacterium ferrireducens]|uniref:spore cortex biosynthesis protein YabQ n=1 Tax=Paradesulfitobacterium ferrireducens TaxID=2816476 RepID=UPI001A8C1B14|nr:spore cortex biosynthesis protein YabQ [Paradesulfitobacterium ferrireducens]